MGPIYARHLALLEQGGESLSPEAAIIAALLFAVPTLLALVIHK